MKRRIVQLVSVAAGITVLDQITKLLVVHRFMLYESVDVLGQYVRLTLIYNENGVFGLAPQRLLPFLPPRVFFVLSFLMAGALVVYMYFQTRDREVWARFAFMLISGGAVGNFIDRVRLGKVIDFIDCDFPDIIMARWPVFNVADSCVLVGISILLIVTLFTRKKPVQEKNPGGGETLGT
jgi:signal peptidase II